MSDSFASSSAAVASSSLLSKYTKLTSSITSTRQCIESTENEISNLMSAIQELKESRREMEQDLSKAVEETNVWLNKTRRSSTTASTTTTTTTTTSSTDEDKHENHDLRNCGKEEEEEYKKLTQTEMELQQEIQMLEQDIEREKSEKEQQRQEFLSTCREFRRMMKRDRITLEGLKFQTGSEYTEQQDAEEKMKMARERKRESEVALVRAQQAVALLREEKQRMEKESLDRVQNLQQQRKQLKKVRGVVMEMEREMHNLEQSTKEFEEISAGYAKDAARRRTNNTLSHRSWNIENSANGSYSLATSPCSYNPMHQQQRQILNPYTNNHQQQEQHYHSTTSSNEAKRLLSEQHPHRAGRIRIDRQFTTSLSVGTRTNIQENDSEWRRGTKRQQSLDSISISPASDKDDEDMFKNGACGRKITHMDNGCSSEVDSSDDDDDDDILTFVPFKNNS